MAMTPSARPGWLHRMLQAVRRDWREIGGLGRLALLGIAASIVVAVALGFTIPRAARDHLLDARAELLEGVTRELVPLAPQPATPGAIPTAFDDEVRLRLLGGETVRVKLWLPDGTVVYSDSPELVGRSFELSGAALSALQGETSHLISDLSDPAHAEERDLGQLIEFYIPYGPPGAAPTAAFEIEQRTESLDAALGRISRNVWVSIGSGMAVLAVFLGSLLITRARELNRRRRQAELLLGSLLRAQDEERRRIVGALHDDIGQPLYRLLYGIEGSISKLEAGHPAATELERLGQVVRHIDGTLRAELRLLHEGLAAEAGLRPALQELVAATRRETDLVIDLDVSLHREPASVPRAALYRAAREGLTNVRKHAGARRVSIRVAGDEDRAQVEMSDDGSGERAAPGLGLTTTREGLEAIGGGLTVTFHKGRGTTYKAWVPMNGREPV